MKLPEYLSARKESLLAFARRSEVPQQTLHGIGKGKGCTISTAYKIVEASRRQPAPGGGTITYEDLVPELQQQKQKPRKRASRKRRSSRKAIKRNGGEGQGPAQMAGAGV
jgi:hypothetical protein